MNRFQLLTCREIWNVVASHNYLNGNNNLFSILILDLDYAIFMIVSMKRYRDLEFKYIYDLHRAILVVIVFLCSFKYSFNQDSSD